MGQARFYRKALLTVCGCAPHLHQVPVNLPPTQLGGILCLDCLEPGVLQEVPHPVHVCRKPQDIIELQARPHAWAVDNTPSK